MMKIKNDYITLNSETKQSHYIISKIHNHQVDYYQLNEKADGSEPTKRPGEKNGKRKMQSIVY